MLSIANIVPSLAIILERMKKTLLRVAFCFEFQIEYGIRTSIIVILLSDIFLAYFHAILKTFSRTKLSAFRRCSLVTYSA